MAVAGGGSGIISHLLSVPGASATLLEALVPYSKKALREHLGVPIQSHCSQDVASAMAVNALRRAQNLAEQKSSHLFGLGCTASLNSNRPKRGDRRVYAALQTEQTTVTQSVILSKGTRGRAKEEALAADLCLNLLLSLIGEGAFQLPLLNGEIVSERTVTGSPRWIDLLSNNTVAIDRLGHPLAASKETRILFPGAFNPLHAGHLEMARHAEGALNHPVEFEICINNPDKLPMDYCAVRDRIDQFPEEARIWLTGTPTFLEKSRIFNETVFLIGVDTLIRIADPSYYRGSQQYMEEAIEEIAGLGCSFLVYGRANQEKFVTLADLNLPNPLKAICEQVPESTFRKDLSSSNIRNNQSS